MKTGNNSQGFTLIELMVVIVILGILAAAIAPRFLDAPDRARVEKARTDIAALESALKLYKIDNGRYPTTEQGLQALVEMPQFEPIPRRWKPGGYLEKSYVPLDPWKNPYVYLSPGLHGDFDIVSYGRDGLPGGEDFDKDINNWDPPQ